MGTGFEANGKGCGSRTTANRICFQPPTRSFGPFRFNLSFLQILSFFNSQVRLQTTLISKNILFFLVCKSKKSETFRLRTLYKPRSHSHISKLCNACVQSNTTMIWISFKTLLLAPLNFGRNNVPPLLPVVPRRPRFLRDFSASHASC